MTMQPWHWLVFGLMLAMLELFVPSFFLLWFGISAIITALLVWMLSLSLVVAVSIWLVLSIITCVLWFKLIQPNIKTRTTAGLGGSVIIGEVGILTKTPIDGQVGTVRFAIPKVGSDEWMCRAKEGEILQAGDRVIVVQILGNELVVAKK